MKSMVPSTDKLLIVTGTTKLMRTSEGSNTISKDFPTAGGGDIKTEAIPAIPVEAVAEEGNGSELRSNR
jgi:hypothetical protein